MFIIGSIELLSFIETSIPTGKPVISPTEQFFLTSPLYPITLQVVAPISAVVSFPENMCDSFDNATAYPPLPSLTLTNVNISLYELQDTDI